MLLRPGETEKQNSVAAAPVSELLLAAEANSGEDLLMILFRSSCERS
jgi:hypothetical protein